MSFLCKYYMIEGVPHHGVKSANIPCNNCVNAGRKRHINHPGPSPEVMSFGAKNSGSTGGSHSHVHLNDSRNDKHTEVHHGAPGQHSQGGHTVLGHLA